MGPMPAYDQDRIQAITTEPVPEWGGTATLGGLRGMVPKGLLVAGQVTISPSPVAIPTAEEIVGASSLSHGLHMDDPRFEFKANPPTDSFSELISPRTRAVA